MPSVSGMVVARVHHDAGWVSVRLVMAQVPPAMNETESKLMSAPEVPHDPWKTVTPSESLETNSSLRAGIDNRLDALRQDLLGSSPTRLELLLIERVAVAWLNAILAKVLNGEDQDSQRTQAQKAYFKIRLSDATESHALAIKLLRIVKTRIRIATSNSANAPGSRQKVTTEKTAARETR